MSDINLGYATTFISNANGYLGAVLITDFKGFPLEFRYTDPIVPTKVQQILYGKGLEKYLKTDVILNSIINAVSSKIDVLIVQDEAILQHKIEDMPIIRLSTTKTPPLSEAGEYKEVKQHEYLLQTSIAKNPVRIQFNKEFNYEANFDNLIEQLTEVGTFIDIDEPLERVNKSLEAICTQK